MKKVNVFLTLITIGLFAIGCKKEVVVDYQSSVTNENGTSVPNDDKLRELPTEAKTFIEMNFADTNVSSYEIKTNPVLGKSYEVKFIDGVEVSFDDKGNFIEIEDPKGINASLLPEAILTYVNINYKGVYINSYSKENKYDKVELSNDVELIFDKNGQFQRIDK